MLMMMSMITYTHSHNLCKFQQLLSMYFRASGLATKRFDFLNSVGICMNQRWVYGAVEHLAETAHESLWQDIEWYCWFGSHDNINHKIVTHEQRLDNQGSFDSGTAGTIYVIKDPAAPRLDPVAVRVQIAKGSHECLTYLDICDFDETARSRIFARTVYRVLSILTSAPGFEFGTYEVNTSDVFTAPAPAKQLPTGWKHATCAYMLNTVHIDEATYKGNLRVLEEWE